MNQEIAKEIALYNRYGTDSEKWDGMENIFGTNDLLPFWVADMDFRSPLAVREALKTSAKNGVFGYYIPPKSYGQSFIRWEKERHGYEINADWLQRADSVVTGIHQLIYALTNEGDAILTMTPIYYPILGAIKETERVPLISELIEDHGYYTMDFNDIEAKITVNNVKMLLFCSPHNPVGRVWNQSELLQVVEICKRHNVIIVSDEIHQDIVAKEHHHIPIATVGDYAHRVITVTSASKTFNLAGAKNAFLIMEDQVLRQKYIDLCKKMGIHEGNTFGYVAVTAAYNDGETWLDTVLAIIYDNYQRLKKALQSFPEIVLSPLEGTYLAWLDLRNIVAPENLRSFIQKETGLAVNYGDWFFQPDKEDAHIRINLATPTENMEKAFTKLTAAFEKKI